MKGIENKIGKHVKGNSQGKIAYLPLKRNVVADVDLTTSLHRRCSCRRYSSSD